MSGQAAASKAKMQLLAAGISLMPQLVGISELRVGIEKPAEILIPRALVIKGVQGVSSPKRKAKSSVNQQIKAGLSAMRDLLAGRSNDDKVAVPEDKATREVVAAELLAAMSAKSENLSSDTQEIPRFDFSEQVVRNTNDASNHHDSVKPDSPASSG